MEKGLIFALLAAIAFSASAVLVRKAAVLAGEVFTTAATNAFTGIIFFTVVLFFTGEWGIVSSISWRALALLAAVGIIHFVVGRMLGYKSYRLIGANKATPFLNTVPFYAVIFGIVFLDESLTVYLVLGVLAIFAGATLVTMEKKSVGVEKRSGVLSTEVSGIFHALGCAVCWGTTPILIKLALKEIGSPYVGAFIAYAAAAIVMTGFFLQRRSWRQLARIAAKASLVPMFLSGVGAAVGQLFTYAALGLSGAGLVSALIASQALFILLFSVMINRQAEVFTPRVILGMVATVVGSVLLFM